MTMLSGGGLVRLQPELATGAQSLPWPTRSPGSDPESCATTNPSRVTSRSANLAATCESRLSPIARLALLNRLPETLGGLRRRCPSTNLVSKPHHDEAIKRQRDHQSV